MTFFRPAFEEAGFCCQNLIRKNADLTVWQQCELLHVNRSSAYYESKKSTEQQCLLKEEIVGRIDYWYIVIPAMGSKKIAAMLREDCYKVGRNLVRS